MIEVIKHGKYVTGLECSYCGCMFTYNRNGDDTELDDESNEFLYCPECHKKIIVR